MRGLRNHQHCGRWGEITSKASLDVDRIVRSVVSDIGYNEPHCGFDAESLTIINLIKNKALTLLWASIPTHRKVTDKELETKA